MKIDYNSDIFREYIRTLRRQPEKVVKSSCYECRGEIVRYQEPYITETLVGENAYETIIAWRDTRCNDGEEIRYPCRIPGHPVYYRYVCNKCIEKYGEDGLKQKWAKEDENKHLKITENKIKDIYQEAKRQGILLPQITTSKDVGIIEKFYFSLYEYFEARGR